MVEVKDVVQELIKKTEGGILKWTPLTKTMVWSTIHGEYMFSVRSSARHKLELESTLTRGDVREIGSGEDIRPLVELLSDMFPFTQQRISQADVIRNAYECLTT